MTLENDEEPKSSQEQENALLQEDNVSSKIDDEEEEARQEEEKEEEIVYDNLEYIGYIMFNDEPFVFINIEKGESLCQRLIINLQTRISYLHLVISFLLRKHQT